MALILINAAFFIQRPFSTQSRQMPESVYMLNRTFLGHPTQSRSKRRQVFDFAAKNYQRTRAAYMKNVTTFYRQTLRLK
jgi:hypothetical protein